MNTQKLTPYLFFFGGSGLVICFLGWARERSPSWLPWITLFCAMTTWSVLEAILATWRDVKANKQRKYFSSRTPPTELQHKNPLQVPTFRAGIFGLPFCLIWWLWKREPIFELGAGFFAGILIPTLITEWRWRRTPHANSKK